MGTEVILVHGLWSRSLAMEHIGFRLGKAGYQVRKFNYATTTHDLDQQAESLYRFAERGKDPSPHYVSHSMGGLLTLHMLAMHPDLPSGRIVLMGSPLKGSQVARNVSQWPGPSILGEAEDTLIGGVREWPAGREIGMIAGTRTMGLGALAGGALAHSDGTVLAEESQHENLKDHIELRSSHTSMLFSAKAAKQAIFFLQNGYFSR